MTTHAHTTDLDEFDQGWLDAITRTPFVPAIIALSGLTRLGERPASLAQLATIIDRPAEETAAVVRTELAAHVADGLIYWDDPYSGDHTRRVVHVGDHAVRMGSGCGPDVVAFAAVFDVPFWVAETCPTMGIPIRIDFQPGGEYRADPSGAVALLVDPADFAGSVGGGFAEINANVCAYQPLFASAEAARPALAARPGSRVFTVAEMLDRPWFHHCREHFRP